MDQFDTVVLFEPEENNVYLEQLDIGEGLLEIQNQLMRYWSSRGLWGTNYAHKGLFTVLPFTKTYILTSILHIPI